VPVDVPFAALRRAALVGAAVMAVTLAGPVRADTPAAAPDPTLAPALAADPKLEADTMELAHKLRCLVCQNQSIAESNAPLAMDLRDQVREQLAAGKSKDDVIDYLVDRYGEFVLYEPPFRAATMLLWLGPAALLLGGAGWLAFRLRRRRDEVASEKTLSATDSARARALLDGASGEAQSESPESRS
jgi:cytochrome c-type biogenesis protein CcmH